MDISATAAYFRTVLARFNNQLTESERKTLIATAIARGIASRLALPTSPVTNVTVYYAQHLDRMVVEAIDLFNEALVIDTRLCLDLTYKFFKFRYDLCYNNNFFAGLLPKLGMQLPEIFPQNVCDVLNKEFAQEDYNRYISALGDMVWGVTDAITETVSTRSGITPAPEGAVA